MTSPPRVNFLIVGVQKGGTTALFDYLGDDPDIALSDTKEDSLMTILTTGRGPTTPPIMLTSRRRTSDPAARRRQSTAIGRTAWSGFVPTTRP